MSTDAAAPPRTIDIGRLFVVPVMALAFTVSLFALWHQAVEPRSAGAVQLAVLARSLLLMAFYGLVVGFYVLRTRARSTTPSWLARGLAVVATFLPLPVGLLARPTGNLVALAVSNGLILVGLGWSVWSLLHLRRNLSIVAQARSLVRSGPYRLVRHPLYLGEVAAVIGAVTGAFSWPALAILTGLVALQLYRARQEEEILEQAFPEYTQYRAVTPLVVPRGFASVVSFRAPAAQLPSRS